MKFLPVAEDSHPYWLAAFVGLILIGIGLRVFALDEQGYWHDEIYSVAHLSGFDAYLLPSSDLNAFEPPRQAGKWLEELQESRFSQTLDRNLVHEGHPPLYQLGLKGWTLLFGRSIEAVRSFSLVPAVLTIPILYLIGLCLRGPRLAAGTAMLVAVSPYHIYYSIEARNYAWALLFSSLGLLAVIALWQNVESKAQKWWGVWWLAVVGACFTHYYAGLYCVVLAAVLLAFRRRSLGGTLKLGGPFLAFLPWLPVLQAQIDVHSADHWTVGSPGALEAGVGFITALLDQLTGVFNSATTAEQIIGAAALVAGIVLVARNPLDEDTEYDARWVLLSVPAFGLAVLAVDLITDHHTILVSRYMISVLPCLLLLCAWLATGHRSAHRLLLAALIAGNLVGAVATTMGERAPKQMLREAGTYIGNRYSVGDQVLVTPSGPTLLGLAHYLPEHAVIAAAPPDRAVKVARRAASGGGTVWLARQNLGVAYELPQTPSSIPSGEAVEFAGITVTPVQRPQTP